MPEYKITIDETTYTVNIGRITDDTMEVSLDGKSFNVQLEAPARAASKTPVIRRRHQVVNAAEVPDRTSPPGVSTEAGAVLAPLPGLILKILVKEGDRVTEGQPVATMEAMKMENEMEAPVSGTIAAISVTVGENVLENALIMRIEG